MQKVPTALPSSLAPLSMRLRPGAAVAALLNEVRSRPGTLASPALHAERLFLGAGSLKTARLRSSTSESPFLTPAAPSATGCGRGAVVDTKMLSAAPIDIRRQQQAREAHTLEKQRMKLRDEGLFAGHAVNRVAGLTTPTTANDEGDCACADSRRANRVDRGRRRDPRSTMERFTAAITS
jgi:hypothetical protein